MPSGVPLPYLVTKGEKPSARNTNAYREGILALQSARNFLFVNRPRPWAEYMIHQITGIQGDYLETVRVWRDDTLGSETVLVAKPRMLRSDFVSWNGISYVYSGTDAQLRTATRAADTEDQEVTPFYVVGDRIQVRVLRGISGVAAVDGQRGSPVDSNVDGRAFAKVPDV